MNLRDYKNVLLEDKIVNWSDLTPLERLIAYRNSGRNTPHCDCCEEVMHQYEKYAWCKKNGLKLSKKETDYGVINELRNVDGLAMKGDTMTSPWTIIKEFAKFDSQSENPDFFKNEFKDWCDRINKAYREGTLTYLQKLLFQFISLAHTPGNFCIVPEMFNVGRSGPFAVNDKWDLTLNTIEKWYESRDDEVLKNMMQSKYKDMQLEKAINRVYDDKRKVFPLDVIEYRGKHYLIVTFDAKNIYHYRIDLMTDIQEVAIAPKLDATLLKQRRAELNNKDDYIKRHPSMFGGPVKSYTLEVKYDNGNSSYGLNYLHDVFGDWMVLQKGETSAKVVVTVPEAIMEILLRQYADKMELVR